MLFRSRLHQFVDRGKWRAFSTLLLLGPSVPFLFQGQEEAVEQPFTYFADHKPPLSDLVSSGRLEFLAQFPSLRSPEVARQIPVPTDVRAFDACRLDWRPTAAGQEARRLYMDLLALRHGDPVLSALGTSNATVETSAPTSELVLLRYTTGDRTRLLLVNLGISTRFEMNDPLVALGAKQRWELVLCSEHPKYGGSGVVESFGDGCWELQAHCAWLLRGD